MELGPCHGCVLIDPAVPGTDTAGFEGSPLLHGFRSLSAQLIQGGLQLSEDVFKKRDVFLGATFHYMEFGGKGRFGIAFDFDQLRTVELEVSQIGERGSGMLLSHDVLQF